jgi:phage gpG-like protein
MATDRFRFNIVGKEFKTQSINMMREIAMANKNYFLQSFKKQSWGSDKWPEVKRRTKGTNEYKYPKNKGLRRRTRPILIGKGSLRRAVNSSIKSVGPNWAKFAVDLKYAAIHNEGSNVSGKGRFAMPRRQYMGDNAETNKLNKSIIKKYADRSFQK